jgi:hypothetical protein
MPILVMRRFSRAPSSRKSATESFGLTIRISTALPTPVNRPKKAKMRIYLDKSPLSSISLLHHNLHQFVPAVKIMIQYDQIMIPFAKLSSATPPSAILKDPPKLLRL